MSTEDREVLLKKITRRAMHLLEQMDRTEKGLRDKLRQSAYPENLIDGAIAYVKSYGYVDDSRYAENYIRSRMETKSRRQLMQLLYQKGISREIFEAAWDNVTREEEPDERCLIRNLIRKKCGDTQVLSGKAYRQLQGYLARRGFSFEDISAVLEEEGITQEG